MRAITISEPGGPEVLRLQEVPDPEPRPGEVVVQVTATAVNRADLMQRQGHYPPPPGAAPYPGLECSGTVLELGEGVSGWSVGDEVCALLAGGGYAERVAVPSEQLLPRPQRVDLVDAAALPEVTCTVWSNVFMTAGLRPGEVLLVHGGSSGIGTMAIQLGREAGARGGGTGRTAEKLGACPALGGEGRGDYPEEGFLGGGGGATGGGGGGGGVGKK